MEVPPWVFPLFLVLDKKKKKIGIWVFLEVQEINFLGPLKVNMDIEYFYMNFFHFTKKVLPFLTMHGFFRNILPHHTSSNPNDILYWHFLLVDNRTMLIKLTAASLKSLPICYKDIKGFKQIHFSGSYQRNRMSLTKHLWQTPF